MKRLYLARCAGCGRVEAVEIRELGQDPTASMIRRHKKMCTECDVPGAGVTVVFIDVEMELKVWVPAGNPRVAKRKARR